MTTEMKITSMDPAITVLALRGTAGIAHALPGPQRIRLQLMGTGVEVGADGATLARPGNSQMRLGLMTVQTAQPERPVPSHLVAPIIVDHTVPRPSTSIAIPALPVSTSPQLEALNVQAVRPESSRLRRASTRDATTVWQASSRLRRASTPIVMIALPASTVPRREALYAPPALRGRTSLIQVRRQLCRLRSLLFLRVVDGRAHCVCVCVCVCVCGALCVCVCARAHARVERE